MALIRCPECGNQTSSIAVSCPSCGLPIKNYLEKERNQKLADGSVALSDFLSSQFNEHKVECTKCGCSIEWLSDDCISCGSSIKTDKNSYLQFLQTNLEEFIEEHEGENEELMIGASEFINYLEFSFHGKYALYCLFSDPNTLLNAFKIFMQS